MRAASQTVLVLAGCMCFAPSVSAQPWQGRVLVSVNAAVTTTGRTFTDDFTYTHPYSANIPGEVASVDTTYEVPKPLMFDGGVLVRVYRNFAAGVAFHQSGATNDLQVTARIPHPFLIGRHRTVEGTVPVRHEESGVDVMAAYVLPASPKIVLALFGGPTYFSVKQPLVKSVAVTEVYPYDQASFASAEMQPLSDSGWGFNAGVDVGWMFHKHFGAGGLLRYSTARLALAPSGREPLDVDVGGLHAGVGARVAF